MLGHASLETTAIYMVRGCAGIGKPEHPAGPIENQRPTPEMPPHIAICLVIQVSRTPAAAREQNVGLA